MPADRKDSLANIPPDSRRALGGLQGVGCLLPHRVPAPGCWDVGAPLCSSLADSWGWEDHPILKEVPCLPHGISGWRYHHSRISWGKELVPPRGGH